MAITYSDYPFIPLSNDVPDGTYWAILGTRMDDGTFQGDHINIGKISYYFYCEVYTVKELMGHNGIRDNNIFPGRYIKGFDWDRAMTLEEYSKGGIVNVYLLKIEFPLPVIANMINH